MRKSLKQHAAAAAATDEKNRLRIGRNPAMPWHAKGILDLPRIIWQPSEEEDGTSAGAAVVPVQVMTGS